MSDLSTMAALAMIGTFGPDAVRVRPADATTTVKVRQMTTISDQEAQAPDALRSTMTQRLVDEQVIRTVTVRTTFAAIPRHLYPLRRPRSYP